MKLLEAKTTLKAYLTNNNLNLDLLKVIDWCHLVPVDNWYTWSDQINHILTIKLDKYQVKSVKLNSKVFDLYCKAPPQDLIKKSIKIVAILSEESMLLFCLGKDTTLRIAYFNKEWKSNIFPLSIEIHSLLEVINAMKTNKLDLDKCDFSFLESKFLTSWVGTDIAQAKEQTTSEILQVELLKLEPEKEFSIIA